MKRVLVTGAYGFLGRYTALLFKKKGYRVIGIGHGHWGFERPEKYGFDEWIAADVDQSGLSHVHGRIDSVVHCAGGSSVAASLTHPLREFQRTVGSTGAVLEFLRIKNPNAVLIYPSSVAVYGDQKDIALIEDCGAKPVSPYGFYKKIVEGLCESYSRNFEITVAIVRFFSIYGVGLQKQLLWDACCKLTADAEKAKFYGTGTETRDWLNVADAAELIFSLSEIITNGFEIYNGGSGRRLTVNEILTILSMELGSSVTFVMGGENKPGDPKHYWADIQKALKLGWSPQTDIKTGLREYVHWFTKHLNRPKK